MEQVENQTSSETNAIRTPRKSPKKDTRTAPTPVPVTTIYIGPTLAGGKLAKYTTFRGELPDRVKTLVEAEPKLSRLIVPVSTLAEARNRSETPGTPEWSAVQSLKEGKV